MSNFRTQVNFSSQIKEYPNTDGTLSGSVNVQQYTILGTDYLDLPLGLDGSTTGITSTFFPATYGTFTGTTGSTTFFFSDPNMDLGIPYLSALTPSNSGITQNVEVYIPLTTLIVDGNSFDIYYSGVSYDLVASNMYEYTPGEFSGITFTNILEYISGTTYPWWFLKSGSTTWNEVKGRLQTDRMTIIEGAFPGYVLTSDNLNGDATWQPVSGLTWAITACTSPLFVSNIVSCPTSANTLTIYSDTLALYSSLQFLLPFSGGSSTDGVLVVDSNGYVKTIPQFSGGSGSGIVYSGTNNYLPKWSGTTGLTDSVINDNGSQIGIGSVATPGYYISSYDQNTEGYTAFFRNKKVTGNAIGLRGQAGWTSSPYRNTGIEGTCGGQSTFVNSGVEGLAGATVTLIEELVNSGQTVGGFFSSFQPTNDAYGIISMAGYGGGSTGTMTGGWFRATGGTNNYALRLEDGLPIVSGSVWTSIDSFGNGKWEQLPVGGSFTGNTSASCITDLYVTNLHGCSPIKVHDILSGYTTNNYIDLSSVSNNTYLYTKQASNEHILSMGSLYAGVRLGQIGGQQLNLGGGSGNIFAPNQVYLNTNSGGIIQIYRTFGSEITTPNTGGAGSLFLLKTNASNGTNLANNDFYTGALQSEIVVGRPNTILSPLALGVMGTGIGNLQTGGTEYNPIFLSTPRSYSYDDTTYSTIKNVLFGGGSDNKVYTGVTNSALIGGSGNTINGYLKNVAILGGENITATTSNTVYVPQLQVGVPSTSTNETTTLDVNFQNAYGRIRPNYYTTINSGTTSISSGIYPITIYSGWVIEQVQIYTKIPDSVLTAGSLVNITTSGGTWSPGTSRPFGFSSGHFANMINIYGSAYVEPVYFPVGDTLLVSFLDPFSSPTNVTDGEYKVLITYWDGFEIL